MPELSYARRGYKTDPSDNAERAKFGKVNSAGAQVVAVSSEGGSEAPGEIGTSQRGVTTDTTLAAAAANLRILGFTVRESASSSDLATVILRHGVVSGGNATGDDFAYVSLGALQSAPAVWYGDRGLAVPDGVNVEVVSGEVDINVFTVTEAAA